MVLGMGTLLAGGSYAWLSSVYHYNRGAWMTDVQLRQQFEYQCDNMQVSSHQMSRDEVRDRCQAAITKLSNYILVTTLILALAAEILVEGQIPKESADFILNAYMLCLGTSVLYLVLSILFGIVAINQIYDSAAYLLTDKIPPAWRDIDNKMKKKAVENLVVHFESKGWREMFMPPLMRRLQVPLPRDKDPEEDKTEKDMWGTHPELQAIKKDYNNEFRAREQNWIPLTSQSFECLALGVKNLLDVYAYLCLAMLYGEYGDDWAFWAVQVIFCTLNVLLMMFLFERINPPWYFILVAGGPVFCAVAATTPFKSLDRWCVPLCYICHLAACFFFRTEVDDRGYCSLYPPEEQLCTVRICGKINQIGVDVATQTGRISDISPESKAATLGLDRDWFISRIDDVQYSAPLLAHKESSRQAYHITFSKDPEIVFDGSAASAATASDDDGRRGPSSRHRVLSSIDFTITDPDGLGHAFPAMAKRNGNGYSRLHEGECDEMDDDAYAKYLDSTFDACSDDDSEPKDPDPSGSASRRRSFRRSISRPELSESSKSGLDMHERRAVHTRRMLARMMMVARTVMRSLWFVSILWSVQKSTRGSGFKNAVAVIRLEGPPLAHVTLVKTKWPSPYFAPHALVCPKASQSFLADEFHVYRLREDDSVEPYPCDVNGTIADISADCSGGTCNALVLLRGSPPRILECKTNREYKLLQTESPCDSFAVIDTYTLLAAHQGKIVEYKWDKRRNGWSPSFVIGDVGEGSLQALDVVGQRMLVFRRQGRGLEQGVVQVQNLKTAKQCGVWTMPPAILGAGCAVRNGETLKLLVRQFGEAGPQVRLMEAELKELEESSQTCEEMPEEEDVPWEREPETHTQTQRLRGGTVKIIRERRGDDDEVSSGEADDEEEEIIVEGKD